ncbi:hypothetical protein TFLX_05650 [Thermoflexales bacterium]|nr:hypothetical protein TFLX_05650 [Thermoflexales bacterium]
MKRYFAVTLALAFLVGCSAQLNVISEGATDEDVRKNILETENSLVLRTDFSDDGVWDALRTAIEEPAGEFGFRAYVDFVSDPAYANISLADLLTLISPGSDHTFIFVVDQRAISDPEHPILVIDLFEEQRGRSFRVIPSEMWGVENNLSLANLDFVEFAEHVDPDGVFRGFGNH